MNNFFPDSRQWNSDSQWLVMSKQVKRINERAIPADDSNIKTIKKYQMPIVLVILTRSDSDEMRNKIIGKITASVWCRIIIRSRPSKTSFVIHLIRSRALNANKINRAHRFRDVTPPSNLFSAFVITQVCRHGYQTFWFSLFLSEHTFPRFESQTNVTSSFTRVLMSFNRIRRFQSFDKKINKFNWIKKYILKNIKKGNAAWIRY